MKISLEWLAEYVEGPLDPQGCATALLEGGLPVEHIERVGDDSVLDVEVTSNRGDCLSHIGIAREISALLRRPLRPLEPRAAQSATPASSVTSVSIDSPQLCPHYTARVIRGVRVGPSPAWMVRRLEAVGLRSINNVVDVTNYVMYEMGQPLHAFDMDRLREQRIIVRAARAGETLVSIDGHERRLDPSMLVIADARRPVALAGVMGGRDSEVGEATTNVLLESARFDALSVRRTARALAMKSDSSYRFERGIDPGLPDRASLRAAQLILQTAGGELLSGVAEAGASDAAPRTLRLRLSRLERVLGVTIDPQAVLDALGRLMLQPRRADDQIEVTIPSWRQDLRLEVDLIEEIARVVGYDKVPVRDEISIRVVPPETDRRTLDEVRSVLVGAGYYEAVTFSFVSDALAGAFVPAQAASLLRADAVVRKADARLRPSILPGLLEAIRYNQTVGTASARLFEIGSTFWADAAGARDERRRLGLAGDQSLHATRGVVEALLGALDASRTLRIVPDQRAGLAPESCGRIEWQGKAIGHLGRISDAVTRALDLRQAVCAAEIEVPPLLAGAQAVPQLDALPRFPAIARDLSLVLSDSTRYQAVEDLVLSLAPEHLEGVRHVGTYRGKPLAAGTKSLTISLLFRSPAGTLSSEQVEPAVQKVVAAAQSQLGASLRT